MCNTEILKSNLCNYNVAYILIIGDINTAGDNGIQVSFRCWAPFNKCIIKIDGTIIGNAENFDLVIPMYYLLEFSSVQLAQQVVYGFIRKMKQLT